MSRPSLAADLIWGVIAGAGAVWTMDQLDKYIADNERRSSAIAARQAGLRFIPLQTAKPGRHLDYSLAAVTAAVFTVLRSRIPYVGAARGIPFGAAMYVLEDEVLNPITRQTASNAAHARTTGLLTHAGFGLLVDTLLRVMRGR